MARRPARHQHRRCVSARWPRCSSRCASCCASAAAGALLADLLSAFEQDVTKSSIKPIGAEHCWTIAADRPTRSVDLLLTSLA